MIICEICNKEFKTRRSFGMHLSKTHHLNSEDYTLKYLLNNIHPVCKCGCGNLVKYNKDYPFTFRDYFSGHYAYAHPEIWGNKQDPERVRKGANTFKKRYANGEILHWSKGKTKEEDSRLLEMGRKLKKENNPNRAKNISKKNKGIKKSKEHIEKWKAKMKEYWADPLFKQKLSESHINYIKNNHKHYTSKLEDFFENNFLIPNKIKYQRNYYAKEIKCFYDFYLSDFNTIIETDGDYWHCNPSIYINHKKDKTQLKNEQKDIIKNNWCKDNNVKIIRLWESDIKKSPEKIIEILTKEGIL